MPRPPTPGSLHVPPARVVRVTMPGHFSTIGFDIDEFEQFQALAETLAGRAESIETPRGHYLRWRGAGEEVWLQVDTDGTVVGMNPHFTGLSSVQVGLTAVVQRNAETFMDGAFHALADPSDDQPFGGAYPFVFDTPDFGAYANLELPARAEAQVAAFAHRLEMFESPEAFAASQPAPPGFSSRSFIPSGLFRPDGTAVDPPEAVAILSGHVVQSSVRTNVLTGTPYYWALVDSFGGSYDVVAERTLLPAPPPVGGVVQGTFWLSGRLTSFPARSRSWFGRLLGGS